MPVEGGGTRHVCADFDQAFESARADGWRVEAIWPADSPHTALLSRGNETLELIARPGASRPDGRVPLFQAGFHVSASSHEAGLGRAGMRYRDLIPSRMGGYVAASHISIPEGGPVADWVHFHRLALQLIAVRTGWVRVAYQGQGPSFVMEAGDVVLQPPTIRHRVLESSPNLEVVEISIPAEHETVADHDIDLAEAEITPNEIFGGQSFLFHRGAEAAWIPLSGGEAQAVGLAAATGGRAEAHIIRSVEGAVLTMPASTGELGFGFILDGKAILQAHGEHELQPAASFVIPPGECWRLLPKSRDVRLLWVTTNGLSGQTA